MSPINAANLTQAAATSNDPSKDKRTANIQPLSSIILVPRRAPTTSHQMTTSSTQPHRASHQATGLVTVNAPISPLSNYQVDRLSRFWLVFGLLVTPTYAFLNVGIAWEVTYIPWLILLVPTTLIEVRFFFETIRRRLFLRGQDLSATGSQVT